MCIWSDGRGPRVKRLIYERVYSSFPISVGVYIYAAQYSIVFLPQGAAPCVKVIQGHVSGHQAAGYTGVDV